MVLLYQKSRVAAAMASRMLNPDNSTPVYIQYIYTVYGSDAIVQQPYTGYWEVRKYVWPGSYPTSITGDTFFFMYGRNTNHACTGLYNNIGALYRVCVFDLRL